MTGSVRNLAFLWGEDAYGIERAVAGMAAELGGADAPLETWRLDAAVETAGGGAGRAARALDRLAERIGTATLFGGGTMAVVRQPAPLLREKGVRDRLLKLLADIPASNGLAFADVIEGGSRRSRSSDGLRDAVAAAGGQVREFPALTRERMERWLNERAGELGSRLGPGAARLLAERVGAFVREGDIDRSRQTELANGELEKLALYRPGGTASRDDVADLVPEAIPGSSWAFLDAVGMRRASEASRLADRLLTDGTPMPVLIAQLHRRLRELVVVRDHLAAGTRPAELVRTLKLQPFRAERLTEQARTWSAAELDQALEGLLDLDLASKGIAMDGGTRSMSDERSALRIQAWIADGVVRPA